MKRIITLFAIIGLLAFSGCTTNDDNVDSDTIAEVIDVNNVNFDLNGNGGIRRFGFTLFPGDVVLAYRATGVENGRTVWTQIPETYYYDDGTQYFSYKFNFTDVDFELYLEGFNLNTVPSNQRTAQKFRIVIVPGTNPSIINKSVNNKVDYSDYYAVIKRYNINDSNVKQLN